MTRHDSRPIALLLMILMTAVLSGCVTRPASSVLSPVGLVDPAQTISIFAVTNRAELPTGGFAAVQGTGLTYERYEISIPSQRKATEIRTAGRQLDPMRDYVVLERTRLSKAQFTAAVNRQLGGGTTASLFVHGYNQSYQEALLRTAQVMADSGMAIPAVMFSWPSEATLWGYLADRDESLASRSQLADTIRTLAGETRIAQLGVIGHSMGGFLVMETLRELKLGGRSDTLDKLAVLLAAPDIDLAVFKSQMQVVGRLGAPLTVLVSPNDRALAASSVLGSERQRLGMVSVTDPYIQQIASAYGVVVVDISSVPAPDAYGHDSYAAMAGLARGVALDDARRGATLTDAGLYVFDATQSILTSPARLGEELAGLQ